ncbi:helix-turn-helix domain-containing protein [Pedobacter jeongneungensis]|uniref:helix-turn-helix domain-containing protein n=1 Tax=Pedobacter jeongneungensis TaxID=947309 RepID=UPI0009FE58BD|nr:helix-turn-helix domain-containing protein [Pedobacter jeongneungensis]
MKWIFRVFRVSVAFNHRENREKYTEVYLQVGFEDLSHFSFAFKKAFGMAPSALLQS